MRTRNAVRPSDDELILAVVTAKAQGFTSSQIKHETHAAEQVRYFLGPEWAAISLDTIRGWVENLSRAGKEPGTRKRTPVESAGAGIARLLRAFPVASAHSEEYRLIHDCDEYKRIIADLKRDFDYTCQLCNREFLGKDLEGHITDYRHWRNPGRILILCTSLCHPVADSLLRFAKSQGKSDVVDLFSFQAADDAAECR